MALFHIDIGFMNISDFDGPLSTNIIVLKAYELKSSKQTNQLDESNIVA